MKAWDDLPVDMQNGEVRYYYEILQKRRGSIFLKRCFDYLAGLLVFMIVAIPMAIIAILIAMDSKGGIFYRQERVTQYGRKFHMHKFRTMVSNADKIGSAVTVSGDSRVTKIGHVLRKYRLDELPQVIDVLQGNMSFVGTRPEVTKYVEQYTDEMKATLLLPAGITSEASIRYKDEAELLDKADDVDKVYVEKVLPEKMKYNLKSIEKFSFVDDMITNFRTVLAVAGKEYK